MKKNELSIEGRWAVLRDSKGEIVAKTPDKGNDTKNWRSVLRKITDGGQMPMLVLAEIARGEVFIPKLPDGSEGEPQVPGTMARLTAAQLLHEQLYGKAVAQTEIVKAEEETKLQAQVQALSDSELQAKVFAYLEKRAIKADNDPEPTVETNPSKP